MPDEIIYILNRLRDFSHKAYVVGGSVRDFYLGKEPYDYDIATSARPEETKKIFREYILSDIGEKYGTVVVKIKEYEVEITTFRTEGKYEKSRRPEKVVFADSIEEDLRRRDFTVNAMAYSIEDGLTDIFGGRKDIENRIIRTVRNPEDRITEDALRILRAIRLAGQLDFQIEENLYREIKKNRNLLNNLSKERIKSELDKILMSDRPSEAFRIMADTEVLKVIMPDLYKTVGFNQMSPYHSMTLFDHIMCVTDRVDKKLSLRYAALLHDIAKPDTMTVDEKGIGHFYGHDELGAEKAAAILRDCRADNELIDSVCILIKEHMKAHDEMTDKALRRQIRKVGKDNISDLYSLMTADRMSTTEGRDIDFLKERMKRIEELMQEETVTEEHFLKVNGRDIMSLGFSQGKKIGEILSYLEETVLDNPELNEKDTLLNIVVEKYRS